MNKLKFSAVAMMVILIPQLINAYNKPTVNARAAILWDVTARKSIYAKNALAIMAPASTTKIMTAVLTLEKMNLDRIVTIRPDAAAREGTSMELQTREKRTVRELLYGMMLESGNDAATALADAISGTEANFAKLMNEKAARIGMKYSVFKNASGLPVIGHYTTAYDMALLTSYALRNREFSRIVGTREIEIPGAKPGETRELENHNKLLWRYPYAVGVKTGYTVTAGGCLVSAATFRGRTLIAVVLKTGTIYDDSIKLFNYGFGLN